MWCSKFFSHYSTCALSHREFSLSRRIAEREVDPSRIAREYAAPGHPCGTRRLRVGGLLRAVRQVRDAPCVSAGCQQIAAAARGWVPGLRRSDPRPQTTVGLTMLLRSRAGARRTARPNGQPTMAPSAAPSSSPQSTSAAPPPPSTPRRRPTPRRVLLQARARRFPKRFSKSSTTQGTTLPQPTT